MNFLKKAIINLTVILVLVSLTSQVSLRIKREEDPSETDNAGPLDESLRLDHLPLHDETELATIENDIKLTPNDNIVESTPSSEDELSDNDNEFTKQPEVETSFSVTENSDPIETTSEQSTQGENTSENSESEQTDTETSSSSESEDVGEATEDNADDTETSENNESEVSQTTTDANEQTDDSEHLVDNPNEDQLSESDKIASDYEDEIENFIDKPSDDQLLESKKIADDYESESEATTRKTTEKPNVWFKPTKKNKVNDTFNDESHISANCPSLNCEFGYKTDLYGKPICACFNPCYEKKCGTNVCKIEKLTEDKFIGACYDPNKIERPLHCHLPLATGTCKNYTSRFYFNSFTQKCSHFIYTGCNGNQNNFEKWEKCEMECNTCSLPASRGQCHGNIIRYHYDPIRRECVAFNWGGCKGNENNFSTRKHCEDSCIFRKEGALFLHGMPVRAIRIYHRQEQNQDKN